METSLSHGVRRARSISQRSCKVDRAREHRFRIADAVVEAPAFGLVAQHRSTGVEQFARATLANDARQKCARAHVRTGEADLHEEKRHLAARRAQSQIAR